MKKRIAMLLLIVMLFALIGCNQFQRPVLRVAMSPDFAPMEFIDTTVTGQDRFVGFDVSLAKYLAREMGMDLEIVPMSFDACQNAVAAGQVDMAISGFTWMPNRAERFNLSDTYRAGDNSANQVLLTTADHLELCSSAESLSGLKIGAQSASLQEWLVTQQLPGAVVVPYTDIADGIAHLRNGDFAAMAVAEGNADSIVYGNPDLCKSDFRFALTEDLLDNLILMKKGNDELTETVNDLLANAASAGFYEIWYAEALEKTGVGVEITYDDEGNAASGNN